MRIGIYQNDGPISHKVADELALALRQHGIALDNKTPDVVISVGGDGTLLGAFRHYINQIHTVRFVGLHTGHLGFYTDWLSDEIPALVAALVHDNGQSVDYPLLSLTVEYDNGKRQEHLALNEAVVKQPMGTLVADIYLGGELFERFRGDGVSVSTPTGSTAYNKSNGGAVLHPNLSAIQMSEISSLNNRVFRTLGSPLIVPKGEEIIIEPAHSNFALMFDQGMIATNHVKRVRFKVAEQRVHFAEYRHVNFWRRVHNSFINDIE